MAWPNTVASKITVQFFEDEFQQGIKALLNEEILIEEMNFFPFTNKWE